MIEISHILHLTEYDGQIFHSQYLSEKVVKKESSEVIDSVENRLKNLSTLTLESQEDLKIVEERTGKFKHDTENEDPLIEEINDDMSYDELMNLYEKKFED